MWLFQTFFRFWKQKIYTIWWNFIVRHCIFSHLEEKHSTFFPHMETHPNFLNFCIVIPYNMLFPMNQHLGYLPMLLSELAQIENSLIWSLSFCAEKFQSAIFTHYVSSVSIDIILNLSGCNAVNFHFSLSVKSDLLGCNADVFYQNSLYEDFGGVRSTGVYMTWISNHTHVILWDVITYSCHRYMYLMGCTRKELGLHPTTFLDVEINPIMCNKTKNSKSAHTVHGLYYRKIHFLIFHTFFRSVWRCDVSKWRHVCCWDLQLRRWLFGLPLWEKWVHVPWTSLTIPTIYLSHIPQYIQDRNVHSVPISFAHWFHHGPLTRYRKLCMRLECRDRFPRHRLQRKLLVSDPSMHHGTCMTHVSWCMAGSLTCGDGENVPGIPGAWPTRNFTYLVKRYIDFTMVRLETTFELSQGSPWWNQCEKLIG